jgi:hypothetical protein
MVSKYLSLKPLKTKLYDKAVDITLKFYESVVLPPGHNVSLKNLKLKEYRDRKKLLHPYERETLI